MLRVCATTFGKLVSFTSPPAGLQDWRTLTRKPMPLEWSRSVPARLRTSRTSPWEIRLSSNLAAFLAVTPLYY